MPFIVIIILLLMVLSGLLIYFFMFYKPSQDLCSNLYASNICTTEMCTKLEVCPAAPTVEWKPKVKADNGKFLGHSVEESLTGTFGSAYTAGLASLETEFGSNVCDTLASMDLSAYYHSVPATVGAPASPPDANKINCIKMINKIDEELKKTGLTRLEKNKLLEVRRAMIDTCSPLVPSETKRTGFNIGSNESFPTTAITGKKDGAISKLICP
jgi:hypothetical protein